MVFLNLPPIGCFPALRMRNETGECLMEASSYIKLHNEALFQALKQLAKRHPGFKYSLHDFYTTTLQRINRPLQYGIDSQLITLHDYILRSLFRNSPCNCLRQWLRSCLLSYIDDGED